MNLLLHICCAPCLIYPLERLKSIGNSVEGVFYNPNIHPFSEYKNRKKAVEDLSLSLALTVKYPDYLPQDFFNKINLKELPPERCFLCWSLRLEKTAFLAKDNGFDAFTSTLLVSPYQDQEALKKIGNDIAKNIGIEFYYEDFRVGFKKAHEQAKTSGIYCQKYCGCIYSERERFDKTARK